MDTIKPVDKVTYIRLILSYGSKQASGKHLGQMLEALPQVLGKMLKHKHKCFDIGNASSTK